MLSSGISGDRHRADLRLRDPRGDGGGDLIDHGEAGVVGDLGENTVATVGLVEMAVGIEVDEEL